MEWVFCVFDKVTNMLGVTAEVGKYLLDVFTRIADYTAKGVSVLCAVSEEMEVAVWSRVSLKGRRYEILPYSPGLGLGLGTNPMDENHWSMEIKQDLVKK